MKLLTTPEPWRRCGVRRGITLASWSSLGSAPFPSMFQSARRRCGAKNRLSL